MKRTLLIKREIEAGDDCSGCEEYKIKYNADKRGYGYYCNIFGAFFDGRRLPACLEAERRAREVEK